MHHLISFKPNLLLYPFGLYNNSVLCYFNSLLQTLLSCTSITEYLLRNETELKQNKFLSLYIQLIKKYINSDNHSNYLVDNLNLILFNEFLAIIKLKKKKFGYDQEDSGELLILLLEIINDTYITNLFLHRYKCDIYCQNCKTITNIKSDISSFFEININDLNDKFLKYELDKNLSNLNKYIRNNYSELENYECSNCKYNNMNIKINRLTLVPTIIVINLNKYIQKYNYQYPIEMLFINKSFEKCYKYKLISIINHSGSQNFGHYITKTIRKNHEYKNFNNEEFDIYLLNDTSYQKDNFKSDSNTYLLFYHYIETTDYFN